jgi:hypothetical protein
MVVGKALSKFFLGHGRVKLSGKDEIATYEALVVPEAHGELFSESVSVGLAVPGQAAGLFVLIADAKMQDGPV